MQDLDAEQQFIELINPDRTEEGCRSDEVHDGGFDGDVTTVERRGAMGDAAIQISQARFAKRGARHAVLVRDDAFPDSLVGAPLSAYGPLLFTPSASLDPAVRSELLRVLPHVQPCTCWAVRWP